MFNKILGPEELTKRFVIKNRDKNVISIDDALGYAYQNLITPSLAVRILNMPEFNRMTGGLRPREFTILCGSTGVGKTTFIANLSAEFLRQDVSHYVASVETGALDYVRRVISSIADVDLNTGDTVSKDRVMSIHKRFGSTFKTTALQLALYENRTKVEELMSDIAEAHINHGCKVAIIDNLNFFMEVTRASDANIEMDRVVHELIIFCKQIDVHVIMVMHPKKNSTNARDTRVESEFEVRGSALAVQEAHNVFLLNRPRTEDVESGQCTVFDRELKIAKMRRYGKAVGTRIIFESHNGVRYTEKGIIDP